MRTVILVSWRGGQPDRETSWAYVRPYLDTLGYPVYVGESDDGPFNLAQATNRAAAAADADGPWDVAVCVGADCVIPAQQVHDGVALAIERQNVVLPHNSYVRLTRQSTRMYLQLGGVIPENGQVRKLLLKDSTSRQAPAGYVVIPRSVWDRIGGYDERFKGWGAEDAALLVAAGYFERLPGPIYHLWHPESWKARTPEQEANYALWRAEYWGRAPQWMLVGPGKLD